MAQSTEPTRRQDETHEQFLDRLNEHLLRQARIDDRRTTPVYAREQDRPGSETWAVAD